MLLVYTRTNTGIGLKAIYHGYSMVLFLAKEIEDWKPYLVLCKGNEN
jgi:hypothetical protein